MRTISQMAENILLAIGFLKLAFLTLFFLSFPFLEDVQANDHAACTGVNLLEQMADENPQGYAQVLDNATKIENGSSILWRVEKEGQPSSWLFGTMHMADPKISTLQPDVIDALNGVQTVILETTDVLNPEAAKAAMSELSHLTVLPWGSSLKDFVDDELEEALDKAVSERGIPAFLANRMQPWLIATTIAIPTCEIERKTNGALVLDSVLGNYGLDNGKNVKGLETSLEQLEAIAGLPQEYHVSALEETLRSGSQVQDMSQTMMALYLNGEISKIMPLMEVISPESFTGEGVMNFQERLINNRNVNMVDRALPMFESESVFMAVGALHLPGDKGIVKLLRDKGYTVTSAR